MDELAKPPDDFLEGFGPNELALLARVPTRPLRRAAAQVVRTKERLQFTGWLQYVLPLGPAAGISVLAGLAFLLGFPRVAFAVACVPGLVVAVAVFDLITSKFKLRPRERRPIRQDGLNIFELMRSRRSCRSYQTRPMADEDREAVLASVRKHVAAVAHFGPEAVRLEYVRGDLTVWPVVNAGEFLVAIVPKPYDRRAVIDVGRTLQRVVIDATRMGLGTCWIGPGADHVSIRSLLGDRFDERREQIICVCAVGYRSRFVPLMIRVFGRVMGSRKELSELFFLDEDLSTVADFSAPGLAPFASSSEACQWAPSSYNGQTTRAVLHTDGQGALASVDFYAATASRFYAPVALGIWCANWELGTRAMGIEGLFRCVTLPDAAVASPRHDVTWEPIKGER